jgi:hypothetical protein
LVQLLVAFPPVVFKKVPAEQFVQFIDELPPTPVKNVPAEQLMQKAFPVLD